MLQEQALGQRNVDLLKRLDDVAASLPPGTDPAQWLKDTGGGDLPILSRKLPGRGVKGDLPGHDFHGNQWTSGEGSVSLKRAVSYWSLGGSSLINNSIRAGDLTPEAAALLNAIVAAPAD